MPPTTGVAGGADVNVIVWLATTANDCVYAACLALFEADYAVRAIRDCISSASDELRTPWLGNIDSHLGAVISLEEFEDMRLRAN